MKSTVKSYSGLLAGVVAISFAAIFIRLAEAPPTLIAALRLIFSSLFLIPVAIRSKRCRRDLRALTGRDVRLIVLAGVLLSLHFLLWISSLFMTSVASSVVFVTTNPLFVALFAVIVFKERVNPVFWTGLAIAIAGGVIMGGNDILSGGGEWKGDILALLGAIAVAGYFLVGSRLRAKLSLIAYVFPVYSVAAIVLSIFLLASGVPLNGYGWRTYLYCFLLALVCQLFGHSLFNWALKHLRATVVTLGILGEPVGASILAFLILGEVPAPMEIVGGAFIITGICHVLYYNPDITRSAR